MRALARLVRRFAGHEGGATAVEFAMVLPVLLVVYIGGIEVSLMLTADRRTDRVASTVGDLVAQYEQISTSEMQNIFDASIAIMDQQSTDCLTMITAAVDFDEDAEPTVAWSAARPSEAAFTAGEEPPIEIPEEISLPNDQIIVGRATCEYATPFTGFMEGFLGWDGYSFEHTYFFSPRQSSTVAYP